MTTKAKGTHTRFPWKASPIIDKRHRYISIMGPQPTAAGGDSRVQVAMVTTSHVGWDEAAANARIIEAVSQLAEACRSALARICSDVCGARHVAECEQLRAALKAAGIE